MWLQLTLIPFHPSIVYPQWLPPLSVYNKDWLSKLMPPINRRWKTFRPNCISLRTEHKLLCRGIWQWVVADEHPSVTVLHIETTRISALQTSDTIRCWLPHKNPAKGPDSFRPLAWVNNFWLPFCVSKRGVKIIPKTNTNSFEWISTATPPLPRDHSTTLPRAVPANPFGPLCSAFYALRQLMGNALCRRRWWLSCNLCPDRIELPGLGTWDAGMGEWGHGVRVTRVLWGHFAARCVRAGNCRCYCLFEKLFRVNGNYHLCMPRLQCFGPAAMPFPVLRLVSCANATRNYFERNDFQLIYVKCS